MATPIETVTKEKKILTDVRVARVGEQICQLRDQLAHIYYQLWHAEGLCGSHDEAWDKISRFDPDQSFAVLDQCGRAYALINTITTDAIDIFELCHRFPTYQSVEQASFNHQTVHQSTFRICFSITALPGFRVQPRSTSKDISLSQFLLANLPNENGTYKLAYSRWPAVSLHDHFGAIKVAELIGSRPNDQVGQGQNVMMLYGKTPAQTETFKKIAATRLLNPPETITIGNAKIYTDALSSL